METFINVGTVPTKIVCFGKNSQDRLEDVNFLILVIPGNPGLISAYREFMTRLYSVIREKYLDASIPVWGISHAGHERDGQDASIFPSFEGNKNLYSLEGQYQHKLEFIKNNIPSHIKIIGIGHSIGAKIWSEIMKRFELLKNFPKIMKCFMLFPTMERMRTTPHGRRLTMVLSNYTYIRPIIKLFTLLPKAFHSILMKFRGNVPPCVHDAVLNLLRMDILDKVFFLARGEMEQVWELDVATVTKNLDKLFFFFSVTDDWMPMEYVEEMRNTLPGMKFQICERSVEHAFMIGSGVKIADMVGRGIEEIGNL